MSAPAPIRVRLEHHAPGRLGIGERAPRISWQTPPQAAPFDQQAYRIEWTIRAPGAAGRSGTAEVPGVDQVLVPWPGPALQSRDELDVRVQVRGAAGWGDWSAPVHAEVGLLERDDWTAQAIGPAWPEDPDSERRPPRVRREFDLPTDIASARLYLTAHGVAEAEINGQRVGDEELTPGWTSYAHRLRYATFDVTALLQGGRNAIGIQLADGWWRGRLGFAGGRRNIWGADIAAIAQLEVVAADGRRTTIATDGDWRAGRGPILSSSLYDGEHVDLRLDDAAWATPQFPEADWSPVTTRPIGPAALVAPTGPPVRCTQELVPVGIERRGDDRWILDFGQNHSGRLRLRLPAAEAGRTITLRHSEVREADGELATEPLRTAAATDRVVLRGQAEEWEPRFTIHGYRYAEIAGWPGELRAADVVSRVLHTDLERRGWFTCSDPLVGQLHENVVWGLRSNFVDVPTDCPQRDERLGWTGDIQVFTPAAAFLYDVTGMLDSWLQDLAVEQQQLDWVPLWVPYFDIEPVASLPRGPSAVWGDAALLIPDVLQQRTGDTGLLRQQYRSATAWVDAVEAAAGPGRICHDSAQLGDWLDPAAPSDDPAAGRTDRYLVATAYFAHAARRLAAIAATIGEDADAARYGRLADEVAQAYASHYLADGLMSSDAQTAFALTTVFDLWPDEQQRRAGVARLAELLRVSGWTIGTGFAGTPAIADALTIGDELEAAYALLTSTTCPSWLYAVTKGATTIWERWDSIRPDGSINNPWMTSFNHYALGAVADWLHRVVAGIAPLEAGYRRIEFAPRPGGAVTSAAASHDTPYGRASIRWSREAAALEVEVEVPPGATGLLRFPSGRSIELAPGTHRHTDEAAR